MECEMWNENSFCYNHLAQAEKKSRQGFDALSVP
jgi:hypothetical protein